MIFTSENNWYSWSYGTGPKFSRQQNNDKLQTHYEKFTGYVSSFSKELTKAASSTLEQYPNIRPSILFSGGADSEIVLRSYLKIGSNPKVYIIRYENDYNIYDVSYAVTICSLLGVDYSIVDFNLQKFYENDAEKVSELAQICRPRALPQCKFVDLVDGLPIICSSDLTGVRTNDDYSVKGTWLIRCCEHDIGWSKYLRETNRPGIAEWFKWSPGLVISFTQLKWFKRIINDEYLGKLGFNSTKLIGYREAYPDLIDRRKQTGFEKTDSLVNEFESFLQKKYNGLPYRQSVDRTPEQLKLEILGNYKE
jgi:hypothetical protein